MHTWAVNGTSLLLANSHWFPPRLFSKHQFTNSHLRDSASAHPSEVRLLTSALLKRMQIFGCASSLLGMGKKSYSVHMRKQTYLIHTFHHKPVFKIRFFPEFCSEVLQLLLTYKCVYIGVLLPRNVQINENDIKSHYLWESCFAEMCTHVLGKIAHKNVCIVSNLHWKVGELKINELQIDAAMWRTELQTAKLRETEINIFAQP